MASKQRRSYLTSCSMCHEKSGRAYLMMARYYQKFGWRRCARFCLSCTADFLTWWSDRMALPWDPPDPLIDPSPSGGPGVKDGLRPPRSGLRSLTPGSDGAYSSKRVGGEV